MKAIIAVFSSIFFILLCAFAVAPQDVYGNPPANNPQQGNIIAPMQTGQQGQNNGNSFGFGNLDMGMPSGSFADPEYVAQQKIVENMTTAYNWIALNSTQFAEGCRTDKAALTTQIATVVQQAQETSSVCRMFAQEASACNPEMFCSRFSSGQLPLPPQTTAALKKAGYDTTNLKVNDITQEMMVKVCIAQMQPQIDERKQMLESVKSKISEQLPAFKVKCEEFKKNRQNGPNIQLPQIGNFPAQQYVQQGQQGQAPMMPQTGQQGGACQEPHPDCGANVGAPFCQNGNWVCPHGSGTEVSTPAIPEGNFCQGQAQDCSPNSPPYCLNGNWTCPSATPPEMPVPEQPVPQIPAPEPQPAPEPEQPAEPAPVTGETAAQNLPIPGITGFVTEATNDPAAGQPVCGNTICEPGLGETYDNCPKDCMAGSQGGGQTPKATTGGSSGGGGYGVQAPMQQQNQINNTMAPGPSPEALCSMTDEEIIESYAQGMNSGPTQQEIEYNCKMESSNMLQSINQYKLEIARCKADASLDCESKRQALKSCDEMKDSPDKIAQMIVENMCRRFGTTTTEQAKNKLYEIANKWYSSDPALANQLGDTADKTIADQKKLGVISYFFGDGNYSGTVKERATKLRAIRERLVSNNASDPETLSELDSQIKDLETESDKFGNFFDITRLGYMFR